MRFVGPKSECFVFTYKRGVLSKLGHDLRLAVPAFEVTWTDGAVRGHFDLASLVALCARRQGADAPGQLSAADLAQIARTAKGEVLHTERFASAQVEASDVTREGDEARATCQATLHGVTRPVPVRATREGRGWIARARLMLPDFGMKPYRALMGALALEPHVDVEVHLAHE